MWTRIGGREAIAKDIDKCGSKTGDTTEDKNVMPMEYDTYMIASQDEDTQSASVQQAIDILENNIHEDVKHSKGLLKKP